MTNLRSLSVFIAVLAGFSQSAISQHVSRAFCGDDGKAHVVYQGKPAITIPPEQQQVGCADLAVADDGHTVAWATQVENCCTSYPIAMAVVIFGDGKKTVIPSSQMVWQWRFLDHGKRVAMLSGPVHGSATEANLYDAHTGKKVETWNGSGKVPQWASAWENEFAPAN